MASIFLVFSFSSRLATSQVSPLQGVLQNVQEDASYGNVLRTARLSNDWGGIYIPHLNGIVVSPYAQIGDNATILQQVTLGVDLNKNPLVAPRVGKGVLLGAGSKVIGDVVLGDGCKVGANAVVTRDVPDGKTVVGSNRIL